jgi:DNA-binding NarL/FixJ family response regulator
MPTFKVLVVDDYEPFRRVVRLILQVRDDLQIVGEASDGLEAVQKAKELRPDLILLDIDLPTLTGMQVARRLHDLVPRAKVLFLSVESSSDVVTEALSLGAGYVYKLRLASELLPAIEAVLRGEQFVDGSLEGFNFTKAPQSKVDQSWQSFAARPGIPDAGNAETRRLREIAAKLMRVSELTELLDGILDTAIELIRADFGNIQLLNQETSELKMMTHRGFGPEFVDFFGSVPKGKFGCGSALKNRSQVIVEDVSTDPIFHDTQARIMMLNADARACQSTPIFTRTGEPVGMLNTLYRRRYRPSDNELQFLDLLARHAADCIQRLRGVH